MSGRRVINGAVHGKSTVISESYSSVARDIPGDILGKGGLPASSWTTRFNLSDFQEHRRSMTPPSEDPFTTGKGSGFLGGEAHAQSRLTEHGELRGCVNIYF